MHRRINRKIFSKFPSRRLSYFTKHKRIKNNLKTSSALEHGFPHAEQHETRFFSSQLGCTREQNSDGIPQKSPQTAPRRCVSEANTQITHFSPTESSPSGSRRFFLLDSVTLKPSGNQSCPCSLRRLRDTSTPTPMKASKTSTATTTYIG